MILVMKENFSNSRDTFRLGRSKVETFINPAGFIEQWFSGPQKPESLIHGVEQLVKKAKKINARSEAVLILVDASSVPKIDGTGQMAQARKVAVKAMKSAPYNKIAVYGNLAVQIMVNTLALVAGRRDKVKVFADRTDALRWLKSRK